MKPISPKVQLADLSMIAKYSFVISIVHWLTELSDLKFYRIKQPFISIDFVTKHLRSPAPKEITNTKFLHTAPILLNMKVMAIGIYQLGGILNRIRFPLVFFHGTCQ